MELIGLFGLGARKLGELSIDEGKLYVDHVKRNLQTLHKQKAPPALIELDLQELPGEGKTLID